MTMVVDETIVGIWFVAYSDMKDFMAGLSREGETFRIKFRVRYHKSMEVWAAGSRSHWTEGVHTGCTEAEAIDGVRQFVDMVCAIEPIAGRWELLRGARTPDEFTELLIKMPGVNMRKATEEQYRAEFGEPPTFKGAP